MAQLHLVLRRENKEEGLFMESIRGATLIGSLFITVLIIFSGVILMKTIPVYFEHNTVTQSIKSLSGLNKSILTGDSAHDTEIIKQRLNNQLAVNALDKLKFDDFSVEPLDENKYRITTTYQIIKPLFGNISLLFNFHDSYEVTLESK